MESYWPQGEKGEKKSMELGLFSTENMFGDDVTLHYCQT